jgi:hypothetical protein
MHFEIENEALFVNFISPDGDFALLASPPVSPGIRNISLPKSGM